MKKWSVKVENVKEPNLIFTRFERNFFENENEIKKLENLKNFENDIKEIFQSASNETS